MDVAYWLMDRIFQTALWEPQFRAVWEETINYDRTREVIYTNYFPGLPASILCIDLVCPSSPMPSILHLLFALPTTNKTKTSWLYIYLQMYAYFFKSWCSQLLAVIYKLTQWFSKWIPECVESIWFHLQNALRVMGRTWNVNVWETLG